MDMKQLTERLLRPGLLGLAGRVKENACKAELRRYFMDLGKAVLDLNLHEAAKPTDPANEIEHGHAKVLADYFVRLKIAPVIRRYNPVLKSALEHHLTVAYKLADKMDYVQEAEFQEWPDASGQDDHGHVYHGTSKTAAGKIKDDGLKVSSDQSNEGGVYATSDHDLALNYGAKKTGNEKSNVPRDERTIAVVKLSSAGFSPRTDSYSAIGGHKEVWSKSDIPAHQVKSTELYRFGDVVKNGKVDHSAKPFKIISHSQEADDNSDSGNGVPGIDKLGPSGQTAADWASQHASDLITGIDATTADDIAEAVAQGIEQMLGPDGTSRLLRQTVEDMAKRRADMIATTEMNRAMSEAALEKMQRIGVEYKQIILAEDACSICEGAADEDPKPVEESYNTGDDGPPFHPNCRCAVTGARPPDFNEDYNPAEPRDDHGMWSDAGGGVKFTTQHGQKIEPAGIMHHGSSERHDILTAKPVVFFTPNKDAALSHGSELHTISMKDLAGHRTDLKLYHMTSIGIDDIHSRSRFVSSLKNKGYSGAISHDGQTLAWFHNVSTK